MNLPPAVDVLRKQIEAARDRSLAKPRKAADGTIERLNVHLTALLANPEKFTSHTTFSEEMPANAYHGGSYAAFLDALRAKLTPLGYRVEQSHDGGGQYSTVVIRWDLEKTVRRF
jgi:hypothetical protein